MHSAILHRCKNVMVCIESLVLMVCIEFLGTRNAVVAGNMYFL